jgi:hypothetical protein
MFCIVAQPPVIRDGRATVKALLDTPGSPRGDPGARWDDPVRYQSGLTVKSVTSPSHLSKDAVKFRM